MNLTPEQARHIEGYARGLQDALALVTGECTSSKPYDPMTIDLDEGVIHSYAFNLKDGGRHRPLSDYSSPEELMTWMVKDFQEFLENFTPADWHPRRWMDK